MMDLILPANITQTFIPKNAPTLVPQEFEILHMALLGYSNDDIRKQISATKRCVKWRLGNIYRKFGVKNRLELIKYAHENGLKFVTGSRSKKAKRSSHVYAVKVEAADHG